MAVGWAIAGNERPTGGASYGHGNPNRSSGGRPPDVDLEDVDVN